jgi:hypothetical protein
MTLFLIVYLLCGIGINYSSQTDKKRYDASKKS